jgi:site-specific recombinase XerD
MKMNSNANNFAVLFHVRNAVEKAGSSWLYARITINGKRIELSTRQSIDQKYWNAKKGIAKPVNPECKKLNSYLEQLRSSYADCFRELTLKKEEISAETFKKAYFNLEESEQTLCQLISYHNVDIKEALSPGTLKNYFTTKKYLEKFLKDKYKTADIKLEKINYKFITDFEYYLKTYIPKDHKKKLGNNGVMKHMERFRKLINLALKNEWIEKDPFKAYKLKFNKYERGYLTEEELAGIENRKFKIERLQTVLDIFIFGCYTGLSYIDAVNLKPLNIVIGPDQQEWIITQRTKTSTPVKVPLLPKAQEIIRKYSKNIKCLAEGTVLPRMSNQKLNSYLKEIGDVCGIEKNITFHLARHTFATTVTLSNGVPIESVSKMLGHTKISTTQVYAKVIEKKLSQDMNLLKQKLQIKREFAEEKAINLQ